jgi:hypothetical protein
MGRNPPKLGAENGISRLDVLPLISVWKPGITTIHRSNSACLIAAQCAIEMSMRWGYEEFTFTEICQPEIYTLIGYAMQ